MRVQKEPQPVSGVPQPHDRVARLPEVIQISGRSKTMIYEDIKAGRFPAGFLIGKKARAWLLSDIMGWLESCKQGGAV
jgi:prophage regulatory protein